MLSGSPRGEAQVCSMHQSNSVRSCLRVDGDATRGNRGGGVVESERNRLLRSLQV